MCEFVMKTDGLAVSQPSITQKESKISSSYVIASVIILSITLQYFLRIRCRYSPSIIFIRMRKYHMSTGESFQTAKG